MTRAAAAPDDDGEVVLEHSPCACGRLAAVVLVEDGSVVSCAIRCDCGSYAVAQEGGSR